jgi:nitroreductase
MSHDDLLTILDARRWAPSAFNHQPWRFLYTHRDDEQWERFLGVLLPFNQAWVRNASVLLFVLSERTMGSPDKPNHSHSFDAGAAWAFIALQAHLSGFHTHGTTGIDFDTADSALGIPGGFRLEAAVAIGRIGDPACLPDKLRAREIPSARKPLSDLAFRGLPTRQP